MNTKMKDPFRSKLLKKKKNYLQDILYWSPKKYITLKKVVVCFNFNTFLLKKNLQLLMTCFLETL